MKSPDRLFATHMYSYYKTGMRPVSGNSTYRG